MRHRNKTIKLGRMSSHRKAMLNNMAASLIICKKIQTTEPKAQAVVPLIDKLITWAKRGSLHDRRLAFSVLKDRTLVGKLFSEVAPVMADRAGGYTRIYKTGFRPGDCAPMAIIELIGTEVEAVAEKKPKKKKK